MKVEVGNIRQSEEKLELGKELVQEGEFERAELMLKKAIRLIPKMRKHIFGWE